MRKTYFAAQMAPMTNGMKTYIPAFDCGNGLFIHRNYSSGTPGAAWCVSHYDGLQIDSFWRVPLNYAKRFALRLGQKVDFTKTREELIEKKEAYREAIKQTYFEISVIPENDTTGTN